MSSRLPNREQAIQLLKQNKCSPQVINHCLAVSEFALEVASKLQNKGFEIDIQLVEAGALLHDLGRSKTHSVDHCVVGGELAHCLGLPKTIECIIKRHVGAGITEQEANELGWPKDIYVPQTLEEKIVCYADKCVDRSKLMCIETEIQRLLSDNKPEAANRVRKLHQEISSLMGDQP